MDHGPGAPGDALDFRLGLALEFEGARIDAEALAGRAGAVGEDVAQVTTAFGTVHFGATHAKTHIVRRPDFAYRRGETGPAGTGIEFGLRAE